MEKELMIMTGCDRGLCKHAVGRQDRQLNTYDWLADVPGNTETTDLVEVQFKHTRKGYYHNVNNLPLKKGDIVAVEANPGHDIGVVSLTGRLAAIQMKKANLKSADDIRRVYRLARPVDMEKYQWRCGISRRLQQGHLLLYRRRACRLPTAYQGPCRYVPCAHRDEADWRPPGGWSYWWHWPLRS